jgi:hypothetical protein
MTRMSSVFPIACAATALMLLAVPAYAQVSPPAQSQAPALSPATSADVSAFLGDPNALLMRYPLGGGSMVSDVTALVEADLQTVNALLSLVPTSNEEQKNAIGTGLGLAALALVGTNPQAATTLQDALVRLNDPILLSAYAAVTGNQKLAAAGPGAGGSPGGGESATGGGSVNGGIAGSSFEFPNFGTDNHADTFTIPTFAGSGPGTPTSLTSSVSPSGPL